MTRRRLDVELVRRHLARSREHAQELIANGLVKVAGTVATKSASMVDDQISIVVRQKPEDDWVSRGAHKLIGALTAFPEVVVAGRRALDAGASTGGFTQVLLRRDIREVVCVDVGYGQLAWAVSQDPRVVQMDRTNIRNLKLVDIGQPVDLIVADLSYISLETVLPALAGVLTADGDALLMVKPQFEVGKDNLGEGGVVTEPAQRIASVHKIALAAHALGLGTAGVTASPLPGPSGNVEYFLWLKAGAPAPELREIERAVEEGPQ